MTLISTQVVKRKPLLCCWDEIPKNLSGLSEIIKVGNIYRLMLVIMEIEINEFCLRQMPMTARQNFDDSLLLDESYTLTFCNLMLGYFDIRL